MTTRTVSQKLMTDQTNQLPNPTQLVREQVEDFDFIYYIICNIRTISLKDNNTDTVEILPTKHKKLNNW